MTEVSLKWRGSVQDLATDIVGALNLDEQRRLIVHLHNGLSIAGQSSSPVGRASAMITNVQALYAAIAHGDKEHRDWLLAALEAYDKGQMVPQPRGDKAPVPMLLTCPSCGERHLDEGEFATKPHHTHACQSCGMCWRPAIVPTVGVRFLPGFKNAP